jgi:putative ABC transport system permease protein
MFDKATLMISGVLHARVTAETYFIGFVPGILSTVLGTAIAGIGIYKRQTATLFKELEA